MADVTIKIKKARFRRARAVVDRVRDGVLSEKVKSWLGTRGEEEVSEDVVEQLYIEEGGDTLFLLIRSTTKVSGQPVIHKYRVAGIAGKKEVDLPLGAVGGCSDLVLLGEALERLAIRYREDRAISLTPIRIKARKKMILDAIVTHIPENFLSKETRDWLGIKAVREGLLVMVRCLLAREGEDTILLLTETKSVTSDKHCPGVYAVIGMVDGTEVRDRRYPFEQEGVSQVIPSSIVGVEGMNVLLHFPFGGVSPRPLTEREG